MDIGISEFMFGFAFLYEQTRANWMALQAAPVLPSLQEEANLGWDARLPKKGTDFYYQFKLSDYLTRQNARFLRDGTYNAPYFCIKLHRRNNNFQHRTLFSHASDNENTFYVAPEFRSIDDFNQAFLDNRVTTNSRLIPLKDCDDYQSIDSQQHFITYQSGSTEFTQHSKKKLCHGSVRGSLIEEHYRSSGKDWKIIDESFANHVFEKAQKSVFKAADETKSSKLTSLAESSAKFARDRKTSDILMQSARTLLAAFGLNLVIVGN